MQEKVIFSSKNLHISKKSSTFAPDLENDNLHTEYCNTIWNNNYNRNGN